MYITQTNPQRTGFETDALHHTKILLALLQVSHLLARATSRSLVLLDEFGKGTASNDGVGLLAALLQHYAQQPSPPLLLACTHFSELLDPGGLYCRGCTQYVLHVWCCMYCRLYHGLYCWPCGKMFSGLHGGLYWALLCCLYCWLDCRTCICIQIAAAMCRCGTVTRMLPLQMCSPARRRWRCAQCRCWWGAAAAATVALGTPTLQQRVTASSSSSSRRVLALVGTRSMCFCTSWCLVLSHQVTG